MFPYHLKKTRCPTAYQLLKNRNRLPFFHRNGCTLSPFLRSQFLRVIFHLTPSMRRAELIDGLERNWREKKRLIDEKSINNRRTEAERVTRRAETIDGLKQNGRLEQQKQSTD